MIVEVRSANVAFYFSGYCKQPRFRHVLKVTGTSMGEGGRYQSIAHMSSTHKHTHVRTSPPPTYIQ